MLIVREVFIAKPGHAGELAKLMKDEMKGWKDFRGDVLLDLVTDYNKVVMEYQINNLKEFGDMMEDFQKESDKAKKDKKQSKHVELYQTGRREIYRIVE